MQIENGYILGGYTEVTKHGTYTSGDHDYLLLRIDTAGKKLNHKYLSGNGDNRLTSLEKTSDGGLLAGGYSNSDSSYNKTENSRGGYDYWIVKLNTAINVVSWDKTYGGSSDDKLLTVKERKPDEYVLGGSSSSGYSGDKTVPSMGGVDYWGIIMDHTAPTVKPLIASAPDFSIYPNPAAATVNIFTKSKAQFILTNQLGRPMATKVIENNGTMDVIRLTPGVYFITNLATGKKQSVIVER